MPPSGKKTLNLYMNETTRSRLEKLREETNADSLSDVVRRALAMYACLLRETEDGSIVIIRHGDDREKELIFL